MRAMTVFTPIHPLCLAIVFYGLVDQAGASTLVPRPTLCQRFSEPSTVIFRGTVLDVSAAAELLEPGLRGSAARVRMSVDEAIRDVATREVVVIDWRLDFEPTGPKPGEAYLVYAHKQGGRVWGSQWTRVEEAREELELLRQMMNRGTVTPRIYGAVVMFESALSNKTFDQRPAARLPGIKVVATLKRATRDATSSATTESQADARQYETTTDRDGAFRFLGLAPGTYELRADLREPLRPVSPRVPSATATLDTCAASADLHVIARSVAGSVRAHDGTAVSGATVVAVDAASGAAIRSADTLSGDGQFTLSGLPDGRYFIGVNVFRPPTANSPYSPTWYPNGDVASRQAIEVSRTRPPVRVDLTLPPPLPLWTFTGRVIDPSGQPVFDAVVCLLDDQYPDLHECRSFGAQDGTFTARSVVGRRVRATARSLNPPRESEPVDVTDSAVAVPITIALTKRLPDLAIP